MQQTVRVSPRINCLSRRVFRLWSGANKWMNSSHPAPFDCASQICTLHMACVAAARTILMETQNLVRAQRQMNKTKTDSNCARCSGDGVSCWIRRLSSTWIARNRATKDEFRTNADENRAYCVCVRMHHCSCNNTQSNWWRTLHADTHSHRRLCECVTFRCFCWQTCGCVWSVHYG